MQKICSFFGHRNAEEEVFENIYKAVLRVINRYGITEFYVGDNGQFDRLAANAVIKAKEKYPNVKLYLILAYMPKSKPNEKYDGSIFPDGMENAPRRFLISYRNKWIVKKSDVVIGYVKTDYGGAYEALKFAGKQRKRVINLA